MTWPFTALSAAWARVQAAAKSDPLERALAASVAVAVASLGRGETEGNNRAPWLERIGAIPGEPWCAAFVTYCYRAGFERAGIHLPIRGSLGAKHLAEQVAEAGHDVTVLSVGAGDLVCWNRGKHGGQLGHVGLVERVEGGILRTIEGNTGRFPSKVRRLRHDPAHEDVYLLASLRPPPSDWWPR